MARSVLVAAFALVAACLPAACGGGTEAEPALAGLAGSAPPSSQVYAEVASRPSGDLKRRTDDLAARLAIRGADSLADEIARGLDFLDRDGEELDFDADLNPWLGGRVAWFTLAIDSDEGSENGLILAVRNRAAARAFVAEVGGDRTRRHRGVEYALGGDGAAVALVGDVLLAGEGVRALKAAIDARAGESLADVERFRETMALAPGGSLADVYLDVAAIVSDAEEPPIIWDGALESGGLDAEEASAVASVIPREDSIEIEVRATIAEDGVSEGDISRLLGEMPADAAIALGLPAFGQVLADQFEVLDEVGIPGEVPPNQFRAVFREAGIDLEEIAGSLGDGAGYLTPTASGGISGGLLVESENPRRTKGTITDVGFFMRRIGTPGVRTIDRAGVRGFAVRDSQLGDEPIAIVADRDRAALGYGIEPALRLVAGEGPTLSGVPAYREAVAALGQTPVYGFIDGPRALRLLEREYAGDREDFGEARLYLDPVAAIAVGAERDGDLSLTRMIVHFKP